MCQRPLRLVGIAWIVTQAIHERVLLATYQEETIMGYTALSCVHVTDSGEDFCLVTKIV